MLCSRWDTWPVIQQCHDRVCDSLTYYGWKSSMVINPWSLSRPLLLYEHAFCRVSITWLVIITPILVKWYLMWRRGTPPPLGKLKIWAVMRQIFQCTLLVHSKFMSSFSLFTLLLLCHIWVRIHLPKRFSRTFFSSFQPQLAFLKYFYRFFFVKLIIDKRGSIELKLCSLSLVVVPGEILLSYIEVGRVKSCTQGHFFQH